MASLKKLGKKFYVYYYHPTITTEDGKKKQVYEGFDTEDEALERKDEIERKMKGGELSIPSNMSVEDYFHMKFVPLYASAKWKYKTWDTNMSIWRQDILPFFGQTKISKVTPSQVENYMKELRMRKVRNRPKTPEKDRPYLSDKTILHHYVLISCLFSKAVQWEDIAKTPVKCAKSVSVTKTMQRVALEALDKKDRGEVFCTFPAQQKNSSSRVILTTPKSAAGVRENIMSEMLTQEFKRRELKVAMDRVRYGRKYKDYNLVFCLDNGLPMEPGRLSRRFKGWLKKNGLEAMGEFDEIDFHSIRISSTSLKLAVSGGDIKSAQKDLGDKTPSMVLSTYSRSLRKQHNEMNEKFDEVFYGEDGKGINVSSINTTNNELLMRLLTEQLSQPDFLEAILKTMQENTSDLAACR